MGIKGGPDAVRATGREAAPRRARATRLSVCRAMRQMGIDASLRAADDLGFAVSLAEDACAAIMAPPAASHATMATAGLTGRLCGMRRKRAAPGPAPVQTSPRKQQNVP